DIDDLGPGAHGSLLCSFINKWPNSIQTLLISQTFKSKTFLISPAASHILAGGLAGISCWTVSYPQDVVLNRLRVQPIDRPPLYRARYYDGGYWECTMQLMRKEGGE